MDIIIVRHGRPERLEDLSAAAEPGLTDLGHAQAHAVARFLLGEGINAVHSSPMRRARETAQPLAEALGIEPEIVDDLAEIDRGANHYVPMEELKAAGGPAWQAVLDNPASYTTALTSTSLPTRSPRRSNISWRPSLARRSLRSVTAW